MFLIADVIKNVLVDFPRQFVDAGRVYGLSQRMIFYRIQLPIILRQTLPGLLLTQVVMLQATLFASLISYDEIFRIAQRVNSEVYRPVEIYTALAVFFLLLCIPLIVLAEWLRYRYTRDFSER
jgi:polar amino acid transport system permease protein